MPVQLVTQNANGPVSWAVSAGLLPPGLTLDPDTGIIDGFPTAAGTFPFTVQATDANRLASASDDIVATQELSILIDPDAALAVLPTTVPADTQYTAITPVQFTASGGPGPFTFTVKVGDALPPGLSLSSTGLLNGVPLVGGVYVYDVEARTASPPFFGAVTITHTVAAIPVIAITNPGALGVEQVGVAITPIVLAATGGVPAYSWTISAGNLPPGLVLSSGGVISGTPTTNGNYNFTVRAQDSPPSFDTDSLALVIPVYTVINAPAQPAVPQAWTTEAFVYQPVIADGLGPTFTWTLNAGSLPAGLGFNAATGEITGTPTTVEVQAFTLRATDDGTAEFVDIPISIDVAMRVSIPAQSPAQATVGLPYSYTFLADDGIGPFIWSVTVPDLPSGLSLNANTGEVSGTPTLAQVKTFTLQVLDTATGDLATLATSITSSFAVPIGFNEYLTTYFHINHDWRFDGVSDFSHLDTGQGTPDGGGTVRNFNLVSGAGVTSIADGDVPYELDRAIALDGTDRAQDTDANMPNSLGTISEGHFGVVVESDVAFGPLWWALGDNLINGQFNFQFCGPQSANQVRHQQVSQAGDVFFNVFDLPGGELIEDGDRHLFVSVQPADGSGSVGYWDGVLMNKSTATFGGTLDANAWISDSPRKTVWTIGAASFGANNQMTGDMTRAWLSESQMSAAEVALLQSARAAEVASPSLTPVSLVQDTLTDVPVSAAETVADELDVLINISNPGSDNYQSIVNGGDSTYFHLFPDLTSALSAFGPLTQIGPPSTAEDIDLFERTGSPIQTGEYSQVRITARVEAIGVQSVETLRLGILFGYSPFGGAPATTLTPFQFVDDTALDYVGMTLITHANQSGILDVSRTWDATDQPNLAGFDDWRQVFGSLNYGLFWQQPAAQIPASETIDIRIYSLEVELIP